MAVYASKKPDWIKCLETNAFYDDDLLRIIVFFVFHSPCEKLSAMSKTLSEYGWLTPWSKPYHLNKQLKQASSNANLLFLACNYDKMDDALQKAYLKDNFPSDLSTERVCVYNNQRNQFQSVFYHIRNAFAHGRFSMIDVNGECTVVFEDVVKNKVGYRISARMILKKSTLLKWIDIIETGPEVSKR